MQDMMMSVTQANRAAKGRLNPLTNASSDSLGQSTVFEEEDRYSLPLGWMNDKKLERLLLKDNIDASLLKRVQNQGVHRAQKKKCKQRVLQILRSNFVQIILCLLVLIDAAIVIAEIILEIHSLKTHKEAYEEGLNSGVEYLLDVFPQYLNASSILNEDRDSKSIHFHGQDVSENKDGVRRTALLSMKLALERLKKMGNFDCQLMTSSQNISRRSISYDLFNDTSSHPNIKMLNASAIMNVASLSSSNSWSRSHQIKETRVRRDTLSAVSLSSFSSASNINKDGSYQKELRSRNLHLVSEVLHNASMGILVFFVAEVSLKIFCVGLKFFKDKFEVVDAVIIFTSFISDILYAYFQSQEISVMVIFLLWRIVRVINGLMMHEKQRDEFRIALQKKARRISEMRVEELSVVKEMQAKHILALEELCRENGVSDELIKKCKPRYKAYSKEQTNNALKSIAALTTGFMGGLVGAQHGNKEVARFSGSTLSNHLQIATPSGSGSLNFSPKGDGSLLSPFNTSRRMTLSPLTEASFFCSTNDLYMSKSVNSTMKSAGSTSKLHSVSVCNNTDDNRHTRTHPLFSLHQTAMSHHKDSSKEHTQKEPKIIPSLPLCKESILNGTSSLDIQYRSNEVNLHESDMSSSDYSSEYPCQYRRTASSLVESASNTPADVTSPFVSLTLCNTANPGRNSLSSVGSFITQEMAGSSPGPTSSSTKILHHCNSSKVAPMESQVLISAEQRRRKFMKKESHLQDDSLHLQDENNATQSPETPLLSANNALSSSQTPRLTRPCLPLAIFRSETMSTDASAPHSLSSVPQSGSSPPHNQIDSPLQDRLNQQRVTIKNCVTPPEVPKVLAASSMYLQTEIFEEC